MRIIEYPNLLHDNEEAIRAALARFDASIDAIQESAKQFDEDRATATPANFKDFVDPDLLEAAVDTDFCKGVEKIEELEDSRVRELLGDQISADNKRTFIPYLDRIKNEVQVRMKIKMIVLPCTRFSWIMFRFAKDIAVAGWLLCFQSMQ